MTPASNQWSDYIQPFAEAIDQSVEEVTAALGSIAGEPGPDAMELLNGDLETNRRRTHTMGRIRPEYRFWRPASHALEFDSGYLDQLSESLGRQIDAYSSSTENTARPVAAID